MCQRGGEYHLETHHWPPHEEFGDIWLVGKQIFWCIFTLGLTVIGAADEPSHHVELSPVYLIEVERVHILVALRTSGTWKFRQFVDSSVRRMIGIPF